MIGTKGERREEPGSISRPDPLDPRHVQTVTRK